VLDEILEERVVSSRGRHNPRAVKRKMSTWPVKPRNVNTPAIKQMSVRIVVLNDYRLKPVGCFERKRSLRLEVI
jgi:hypothetical protein